MLINTMKWLPLCLLLWTGWALGAEQVDINHADAATLEKIMVGIGPAKAAAIVHFREVNGPFASIESLAEVKGIGKRTVVMNRDRLTVRTPAERN